MSIWESKTVSDTTKEISNGIFVLPVIQRRLVWNEEKMDLIFDTLSGLYSQDCGAKLFVAEARKVV